MVKCDDAELRIPALLCIYWRRGRRRKGKAARTKKPCNPPVFLVFCFVLFFWRGVKMERILGDINVE